MQIVRESTVQVGGAGFLRMEGLRTEEKDVGGRKLSALGWAKKRWAGKESKEEMRGALDKGYTQMEWKFQPLPADQECLPPGFTWNTDCMIILVSGITASKGAYHTCHWTDSTTHTHPHTSHLEVLQGTTVFVSRHSRTEPTGLEENQDFNDTEMNRW